MGCRTSITPRDYNLGIATRRPTVKISVSVKRRLRTADESLWVVNQQSLVLLHNLLWRSYILTNMHEICSMQSRFSVMDL